LWGWDSVHAEHGRDVGTVNIGIHESDTGAALRKRHGDIYGNSCLANAAFAGSDRNRVADRRFDQAAHTTIIGDIRIEFN
jgi:hypothetical protein